MPLYLSIFSTAITTVGSHPLRLLLHAVVMMMMPVTVVMT
jgi:hypothetical protein